MTKNIHLPLTTLVLKNSSQTHVSFFERLFFCQNELDSDQFKLIINFRSTQPKSPTYWLEEDVAADNHAIFMRDTHENWLRLQFNHFSPKSFTIQVDPQFDLYYLFITLIEPLMIIAGAGNSGLFIHASAMMNQSGVAKVLSAWRHTGKTDSMFELASQGNHFLGDDYCLIYQGKVQLYPKSINIFSYNFVERPDLYRYFSLSTQIKLRVMIRLKKLLTQLSLLTPNNLGKALYRVGELAEVATNIQTTPYQLGMKVAKSAQLGQVKILLKSSESQPRFEPAHTLVGQSRLVQIIKYELQPFYSLYNRYKFLYPNQTNQSIENFLATYQQLLKKMIKASPH